MTAMTSSQKRLVIGGGILLLLLLLGYLALALGSGSFARPGTSVGGVDISGMSQEEAVAAVEEALGPVAAKRLRVQALDSTFRVTPADAGLGLDAESSVAPAFGHTWNPLTLVSQLFSSQQLPALPAVDQARLTAEVEAIALEVDQPAVEPALEVRKGQPVVTPGTPGRVLDREATMAAMTEAVLKPRAPVSAVLVSVEPTVSTDAADEAVALAEQAGAAPVTVTAGSVTAQIPGKDVRRALSFTAVDGRFEPTLDGAALHAAIADELAPIEVQGRDATFKIRKGQPKVVKSKVGSGVSDDDLAAAVADVLALPADQRRVTVPVGVREPELTTEEAKALGVKERLSTFTQRFPYAAYRVQNIGQAAERVNGTLLLPGETFSMNDTILERTEANGYTKGFVVGPGGVFAEELGGGVSAAATTTWTAAFFAGMERVQTIAHSIYISRYQPGLEATVAWGIFDMKFRNDTPNAVFITASTTNTSMTVSFWGTKQYDAIEAEFGPKRDIVPFEKIYDDSPECLGQDGVDGFTITVDRVFYQDGQEVKREPITTRYKAAPDVTCGKDPDKKDKKNGQGAQNGDQPADGQDPGSGAGSGTGDAPTGDQPPTDDPGDDVFVN